MAKVKTGAAVLDKLLDGGYESDVITTLYGPPGAGKTTTCLLAALSIALARENKDKKVVFIDTEGGFSGERLLQLAGGHGDAARAMERVMLLKATSFAQQKKFIETLGEQANAKIAAIICDTISSLYRIERGEDNVNLNRELGKQMAILLTIARTADIPIIIATPVYADFTDKTKSRIVGGDILTYSSKCLISLTTNPNGTRTAAITKHRSLPNRAVNFTIVQKGFEEA